MRILTALLVAVIGFGIAVFGIVLGLSASGPPHGIRHIVTLDPPANVVAGQHALVERLGPDSRVAAAGDRLVVESPADATPLIERTADGPTGMHVASRVAFSRAVGFWPRAWLFLVIAGACEGIAAVLLLVKARTSNATR
jgi:hypothetical protein